MKTSALNLVVFFTLCTSVLMAQSNSFFVGANGGANLSKFKYTEDLSELYPTTNSIFGLNGGVSLGFEIQNFTISTGLQYSQKGSEYQTDNFTDDQGTGFFSARERLHYISIPILVGYRKYFNDKVGLSFTMGPSINFGLSGNIDETTEYFGSDQVDMENFKVAYGSGVNDDYKGTQVSFLLSPGIVYNINDKSKFTFNVIWDFGTEDNFNPRYKNANDFFTDFKGNAVNRSTVFQLGYEYHFSFGDKYQHMKTCNNCGSSNEDHVSHCGHCNMVGQFTYQGGEEVKAAPTPANLHCNNCGSDDPGEGKKCVHCHFPLPIPASAESNTDYPKLSVQNNLRASQLAEQAV